MSKEKSARQTWVRYNVPPPGGRSRNWRTGRRHAGLSVFSATESDGRYYVEPENEQVALELLFFLYANDVDIFAATGEVVGEGDAGEPLLNPRTVKLERISQDDVSTNYPYPFSWRIEAMTMARRRGGLLQPQFFATPPERRLF